MNKIPQIWKTIKKRSFNGLRFLLYFFRIIYLPR
ncbi:PQ-loop domain-containing transporter [Chryseobacterium nematophagum]